MLTSSSFLEITFLEVLVYFCFTDEWKESKHSFFLNYCVCTSWTPFLKHTTRYFVEMKAIKRKKELSFRQGCNKSGFNFCFCHRFSLMHLFNSFNFSSIISSLWNLFSQRCFYEQSSFLLCLFVVLLWFLFVFLVIRIYTSKEL